MKCLGMALVILFLAVPAVAELRTSYLIQDQVDFQGGGSTLYVIELPGADPKPADVGYPALAAEAVCHVVGHTPTALAFPVAVHFLDAIPTPMGLLPRGEPKATETVEGCGQGV